MVTRNKSIIGGVRLPSVVCGIAPWLVLEELHAAILSLLLTLWVRRICWECSNNNRCESLAKFTSDNFVLGQEVV